MIFLIVKSKVCYVCSIITIYSTLLNYQLGKACFLVECPGEVQLSERDACPNCSPCVPLDLKKLQCVLEHIGSHILKDQNINRDAEPCGLCLRPSSLCHFWVGKGKGTTGKPRITKSTCVNSLRFNYATAAESTEASPCSNIPISCSLCSKDDPAVW
jgi:hypothetical protein